MWNDFCNIFLYALVSNAKILLLNFLESIHNSVCLTETLLYNTAGSKNEIYNMFSYKISSSITYGCNVRIFLNSERVTMLELCCAYISCISMSWLKDKLNKEQDNVKVLVSYCNVHEQW